MKSLIGLKKFILIKGINNINNMKIRVGVLRGGPSAECKISLKTGESVLSNLPEQYDKKDIVLSKEGEWYLDGNFSYPEKIFRSVDVIFNALHGEFGEDGKVQQIFDIFGIPYTGSGALASAMGMNKILARASFINAGILVPRAIALDTDEKAADAAHRVFRKMGPSLAVKPASSGSSMGISIVHNYSDLIKAIEKASRLGARRPSEPGKVIVEEYIKGREAACGVIDNFRGEERYALPPIEIIPPADSDFFDYKAKYGGKASEICPANFEQPVKADIEDAARKAHEALGCRHYSRADFIISERSFKGEQKVYLLEVNTLPGLTGESLLPKAINAVGSSYPELLDHLIKEALGNKD